ncbi:hypothetical protein LSAT2_025222, partial [Lamellibrachia satsuma]
KPFKCDTCGSQFAFANRVTFNEHLRSHTGEKPFQCDTCGSQFANRGTLNEHL